MEITRFTLKNGLRVASVTVAGSQLAAVNVLYNVGARDDCEPHTGMAHLFEHLMFGGSANAPEFDREMELAGGMDNAWTSDDFTNYWDLLPAINIETALWLESDRMLGPLLTEESLNVQRSVVVEEFKEVCLNRPYGDLQHHLRSLVYHTHPYRYPAIGKKPEDIESADSETVRRFFYSHYAPNNAVLAIVSPLPTAEVERLALKWFGDVPRRQIALRANTPEPEPTEARRLTVEGDVAETRLIIAFPMERYGERAYFAADLLTDILANGKSARFQRNLIEGTDLFVHVDCSISGLEEGGILMVNAIPADNSEATLKACEKAIWEELDKIAAVPPTEHEMERALNKFESNMMFQSLSAQALAQRIALETMHGEEPGHQLATYRSLTSREVQATAATLFLPHRSRTLIYRPRQ